MANIRVKDTVWIGQSFIIPENALDEIEYQQRLVTTAAFKFTDTTIGGNFSINAPPQFTRFADIRVGGSRRFISGNNGKPVPDGGGIGSSQAGGIRWSMATGQFMVDKYTDNPNARYTSPSAGMGRFYSEGIDDFGQDLVLRFGVPEYNSLTQFFGNFYDSGLASVARTGRSKDLFEVATRAAGFLLTLPLQPLILGGQWVRFLGYWPVSKYYYLKPTMYPYWQAVNTIVNGIAVNMGLIPHGLTEAQRQMSGLDAGFLADQEDVLKGYQSVLPDIFLSATSDGGTTMGIDVYKIATRAERIAGAFNAKLTEKIENLSQATDINAVVQSIQSMFLDKGQDKMDEWGVPRKEPGIETYKEAYLKSDRNQYGKNQNFIKLDGTPADSDTADSQPTDGSNQSVSGTGEVDTTKSQLEVEMVDENGQRPWYNMGSWFGNEGTMGTGESWIGSAWEMFKADLRDGGKFVTFRVQYTGASSEDFSNSVEESGIAQKFNSASSSARSSRFDVANGNILNSANPIGALVQGGIDAVKKLASGLADSVQMSGLMALAGNAFVDIPKTWSGSTANLPKASYTIKLRSPYGTKMSRMINLYVPLAMLMAGALPLSTGKRSYTSPFICEAYCKGRHAIRLGMITSLTISRGEGNLGWSMKGEPLGLDVTFEITDLSSIMHLPIAANFGLTDIATQGVGSLLAPITGGSASASELASYFQKGTYDDDNTFTDYLAVLGSLSWQDLVYANRRWRLARYRQMQNWASWKSPGRMSMMAGNWLPGRIWSAISVETSRPD